MYASGFKIPSSLILNKLFPFPMAFIGVLYIVMALVYLFPILYLYRFSAGIRQALYKNNQEHLVSAFTNLKSHYKSIGIIMIVFLCLYPIMLVAMVVFPHPPLAFMQRMVCIRISLCLCDCSITDDLAAGGKPM